MIKSGSLMFGLELLSVTIKFNPTHASQSTELKKIVPDMRALLWGL